MQWVAAYGSSKVIFQKQSNLFARQPGNGKVNYKHNVHCVRFSRSPFQSMAVVIAFILSIQLIKANLKFQLIFS